MIDDRKSHKEQGDLLERKLAEIQNKEESLTADDIETIMRVKQQRKLLNERKELRKEIKRAKIEALMGDSDEEEHTSLFFTK